MRFLADMGISPGTVAFLDRLGHNAIHLLSEGLERLPDPDVLEKARLEDRVLLTHDLDFGDLLAASRSRLPSVITFRLRDMNPSNVNGHLQRALETASQALTEGAIVAVTEGRIRVRDLPIKTE